MPLREETYELHAELDRLYEQRDDVVEDAASISPENPLFEELTGQGQRLDTHIRGVEWAIEEFNVGEVTLAGLTGGEWAELEDESLPGSGSSRIYTVAKGTVEAPYITGHGSLEDRVVGVRDLPRPYQLWAESRINELSRVGNENESSFWHLLAEKRTGETSTDDSNSSS